MYLGEGKPTFLGGTLPVAFVGGSERLIGSPADIGGRDLFALFEAFPPTVFEGPKISRATFDCMLIDTYFLDLTQMLLVVDYYP